MGADGMFRKVFGRKGLSFGGHPAPGRPAQIVVTPSKAVPSAPARADTAGLHPAIITELEWYDLLEPGLARAAMRLVSTGHGIEVLNRIQPVNRGVTNPGRAEFRRLNGSFGANSPVNVAVITSEIGPCAELARIAALRAAVGLMDSAPQANDDPRQVGVRGIRSILGYGLHNVQDRQYKIDWSKVIPLETAFAHLRIVGGTMTDLFEMLLRRSETAYVASKDGSWSASDTCGQYLRTYPAAFVEAMMLIPPNLRINGLKLIEHHKVTTVPEIEALLVAMLAKPFERLDRDNAVTVLAKLDPVQLHTLLARELPRMDIEARYALVQAAGRVGTPEILALLASRAKVEKAGKVQAALAAILEMGAASTAAASATGCPSGEASYPAVTGAHVAVPPRHELGGDDIPTPTDEACVSFVALVEQLEDRRRKSIEDYNARYASANRTPTPLPVPFSRTAIEAAFATLTEAAPPNSGTGADSAAGLVRVVRAWPEGQAWLRQVLARVPLDGALRILKATGRNDALGLIGLAFAYSNEETFGTELLREWIAAGRLDLRDLATEADLRTILTRAQISYGSDRTLSAIEALPSESVWPWLAESMAVFDEAIGLRPAASPMPLGRALAMLAMLPATPQRYLPRLLEIAVSEKRALRLQAMALLRDAKDLPTRIAALLDDKRQPVRINAAGWLADIRSVASEPALRKRLKKESSDPVRTALIIALQRLGADLADVIGPASLIAEAEKANAKTPPALPAWLTKSGLPVVRFRDEATVPPMVVQYWLALAIRLKDPGAHGQFGIYLDQLEPGDARALSNWALESWISFDTFSATHEEATAWAKSVFHGHYASYAGRYVTGAQLPPDAQAQLIASLARQKMGALVNSGTDTKGLLALACRADPVWAAGRVRWFLKKHGRRSNQAMALLEALAGTGAPAALQVVIAASTRLKQKSTQARAADIAQRYADDRGWSVDELADRTVPSAGFDDDGELDLPCGEDAKPYVARLDAALAIHLFNPDGKPIKALPAGDDDNTKDSKKAFTAAKKELTQIVTLQGERLFEAMCVERSWPVADWRLAFHQHPVMRRLIERLVWQGLDAEGQPLALFRPTQEGDFTDADDNDVAIDDFTAVRLAHGALVDPDTCKAWTAHLKDYEVKPFLTQFDTLRSPLTPELAEAEAIIDRQGWAADSLTFRGAAEKRGYQRVMRDSGGCHEYVKTFPSHGITATIWHTGSYAVDENLPLALKELKITKSGHRGPYRLKDVPPVMLAECWADYHAVAAKGAFDPEWEKISPW